MTPMFLRSARLQSQHGRGGGVDAHVEEGRLAGARRAHERDHDAGLRVAVDVVQQLLFAAEVGHGVVDVAPGEDALALGDGLQGLLLLLVVGGRTETGVGVGSGIGGAGLAGLLLVGWA